MSGKPPCNLRGNLRHSWFVHVLAHLSCVTPIACSGGYSTEPTASSTTPLIDGELSLAERDAVVFIRANHTDGSFGDCTGTLLSPHVVITAKHCVTLVQPGEFVCTGAGALLDDGQGAGTFGAKVDPSKIEIYTGTAPVGAAAAHALANFTSESGDTCHDDIAALVLDTAIQQPYPMLRVARKTVLGETVRLVGYGSLVRSALIERREMADVRVIDVGSNDNIPNSNATTPPRSLVVGGATGCRGDSGGPALSMVTGALMGVYSRITGDCLAVDTRNTFMLPGSFSDLFAAAFEQAGEQPLLEPELVTTTPEPVGGADSGASEAGTGGSNAVATGTGGSNAMLDGAGGSKELAEPTEPTRHESLRCSVERSPCGVSPVTSAWFLLALVAGLSRRRFAGRPFSGD